MSTELLTLQEIKEIEIDLLVKFRDFCDSNQIQYFLSNGTLLGSIKYKGYIPWDDDIDIFVPRSDYNRLIKIYKDSSQTVLFSNERNEDYCFPFAKLCDMKTKKEEPNLPVKNGLSLGICIDIFPLDSFSNYELMGKIKALGMVIVLSLLSLSQRDKLDRKYTWIKRMIFKISKVIGKKRLMSLSLQLSKWNKEKQLKYVGCKVWPIYGTREVVPLNIFSETILAEFEGEFFKIPKGYDTYLRSLYGQYQEDPPIEEQVSHHDFKVYRNKEMSFEKR